MIYTTAEQTKLADQSRLKDLYTNDYLNDRYNQNFKIISELYFNKNADRTKLFNVWTNLFSTITDTIANFVWNPYMDLKLNLNTYTKDLVSVWKAVFWIKRVDDWTNNWKLWIYHIPAENHLVSDWINKVFTLFKNIEWEDTYYYILKQSFEIWFIENKLYKLDKIIDNEWVEVALDTIPETSWLRERVNTWLKTPAIFYTELNSLDWNKSELDKIKNLVYSLDRKAVMFETQFLWEIEQFKIFENIHIPETAKNLDWTVSLAKLWKILATDTTLWAKGDIKYISNKNELINDAINYEQVQIKKISSATSIPTDFLWINSTSAVSWTSREIMISAFVKKIQTYREIFTELLQEMLLLFEGQKKENGDEITTSITWNDIFAKNDKDLIEELKLARESGLISQYKWVQQYQNLKSDEDIEEEIERINLITNDNEDGENKI